MARILAVEDDPEFLSLLSANLRAGGHEVCTALDSQAALEALCGHRFDLILLDMVLPDAVGLSLCESIRRDPATATVPIVFLSGCVEAELHQAAFAAGANDFITKPCRAADLLLRIQAQLRDPAEDPRRRPLPSPAAA